LELNLSFFLTSIFLGAGLSMDAFSISLVAGLNEVKMKKRKMTLVAGVFAFFQALMPMIGWLLIHTVLGLFESLERFIPIIAFVILSYIGGKMIVEGVRCKGKECCGQALTVSALFIQGIATSIDALSAGLELSSYLLLQALISALIIAIVTFIICYFGIIIGKKTGTLLSSKATVFGGAVLVIIGLKILISSIM